jgi:glycosyltransferase involved in cell wall biosynthesis
MMQEPARKSWIHHLGYVEEQHRPALYRAARVFVWPSIYEGFGLPVLEAMNAGTPVITSHTSSLPEITGEHALLIDPYNANDLTQSLIQLFSSKSLQSQLSHGGAQQASVYTWQRAAERTLEAFSRATNPKS